MRRKIFFGIQEISGFSSTMLSTNKHLYIYVLGHSLSNIDFDYFQEIRKNVNDKCRWYFSAYSTLDRERAIQLIKELSIKEHQIITI